MRRLLTAATAAAVTLTTALAFAAPAPAAPPQLPILSTISPTSGPEPGGNPVIIGGTNFTGTTAVTFGATPATSFTVVNDTEIDTIAPAGTGTVDITVTNAAGPSTAAGVYTYTPVTVPTVTQNFTITSTGNGTVSMAWMVPASDGGATIDKYRLTADDGVNPPMLMFPSGTQATFTGLMNGVTYTFTIEAHNVAGYGPSTTNAGTPHPTVAVAPTLASATPGDTTVDLSWIAPLDDGGAPVDVYVVQYTDGAVIVTFPSVAGTTYTVTGLTNGKPYDFKVAAHNSQGIGPWSGIVSATPSSGVTVPNAPTGLTATAGNTQVSLSWTAPADGGSPITDYELSYFLSGAWTPWISLGSVATTTNVTGLTNGTSYDFKVRAVNAQGPSADSNTAIATPGLTAPDAPVLTAVAGDGQVDVSWTVPADGGSPITDYRIVYEAGTPFVNVPAGNTSTTITGLVNGTPYTIYMWASNAVGSSVYSNSVTVTPTAAPAPGGSDPGVPVDVTPTGTVSWDANGGVCDFTTRTGTVGSTVTAPSCSRAGFAFAGWSGHGNTVTVADVPQTIPAVWTKTPGTLTITDVNVLPASVKFTYSYDNAAPVDAFAVVDEVGALVCSSDQHHNTCTGARPKPSGVMYAYALNGKVEGPRTKFTIPARSITVKCVREGRTTVKCEGDTIGFQKRDTLKAFVRVPGQIAYSKSKAEAVVGADGKFLWSRTTVKKLYVYFQSEDGTTSNTEVTPSVDMWEE